MWKNDIDLVRRIHSQHGCAGPIVDAGGFRAPCIADYERTIAAVAAHGQSPEAQQARYLNLTNPFGFLGPNDIENPESGGKRIEELPSDHYGTVLCFSVLEHVPFVGPVVAALRKTLKTGGLLILSAPWQFPYHDNVDYHRFNPDTMRLLFGGPAWEILECDWHIRIPADAGVLDIKTGKPQCIEAAYIVARAA